MKKAMKIWKPEINETIEGTLINKLSDIGKFGSNFYQIKSNGEIFSIWGKKQLDSLMEITKIGDEISIKYVGTEEVNQHKMKKCELEILDDKTKQSN